MGRLGVDTAHYLAGVSSDGVMANIPQTALQRHLGRRLCSRHPTPISISFLRTHELSVLIELRAVANFERYPQSPDTAQITGHAPHLLTTPSPAKIRPTAPPQHLQPGGASTPTCHRIVFGCPPLPWHSSHANVPCKYVYPPIFPL